MTTTHRISVSLIAVSLFFWVNASGAEEIKDPLFREANNSLKAAQSARAELLAPRNYARAMKHYRSAEQGFERKKNLRSIREDLAMATDYFSRALEASRLAERKLGPLLKTREDARKVKAARYANESWRRAEDRFLKAVAELERGDIKDAERRAKEAENLYRDAELTSIKTAYLSETRLLLARADKTNVDKHAPKTLQKAKRLLQQAEQALNNNRYDADLPRSLAQQAKYEAKHAIHLAKVIESARDKRLSTEDLILDWETPIEEIAAAADMTAALDSGYQKPTKRIIAFMEDQQARAQELRRDINDLQGERDGLEAEVSQLKRMLGGAAQERVALSERLETQTQIRKKLEQVNKMFSREEAQVLRESNDIIIRLVGLNFPVGRSTIEPKNFYLLTKVQNVIRTFPESRLIIEGHTDSFGSDAANYVLSQKRADAVKQYLLANMRIDASKIASVGYGETKPVANNETRLGRARNRRIDIVISLKLKSNN